MKYQEKFLTNYATNNNAMNTWKPGAIPVSLLFSLHLVLLVIDLVLTTAAMLCVSIIFCVKFLH